MSRVQPPGSAPGLSLRTPLGANTDGGGQVLSVDAMKLSILNGWFRKSLVITGVPELSVQGPGSGGDLRLTSFCNRQR
jgi:hypothetical protein